MPNTVFHTEVMTSEGAELLEKARLSDDKIVLSRLVLLPDAFDRSKCVAINLDFLKKNYLKYFQKTFDDSKLQKSNEIVSVITPLTGSKSGITIQAKNCCNAIGSQKIESYTIKTVCALGYLKSEDESETQQSLCVFAVFSDDNSSFVYNSEPLSFSLGLCIDSEYIDVFGADISPYANKSYVNAAIGRVGEINVHPTIPWIDGLHFVINNLDSGDHAYYTPNTTPVYVGVQNNKLVLISGNGDKYTLNGTFSKSNVFDPVDFTAYTNHNNPGVDSSLGGNTGSSPDLKYRLNDANGNYIAYNDALTYTVKGVYKADDTEVTTTGRYILAKNTDNYLCIAKINDGYGWTAARVEYTAE